MSLREREIAVRAALISVSGYIGGTGGIVYTNDWHVELSMFNPISTIGLLIGSIITPVANVVLIVGILLGIAYMFTRVPRWSCVVCGVAIGVVVAMVRVKWRTG